MTYAERTRDTAMRFKGLVHRRRLEQAARLVDARPDDTVLDYGCGDGHFFTYLVGRVPDRQLVGYDPLLLGEMSKELAGRIAAYDDAARLVAERARTFSLVVCLEVCEHLDEEGLAALFANVRALAAPGARVVVGVPIETGPSGFLKNLYRWWHGHVPDATLPAALRSLLGLPVPRWRPRPGWLPSHVGFDHRAFRRSLAGHGLTVERTSHLPVAMLRGLLNNEIYFHCRAPG